MDGIFLGTEHVGFNRAFEAIAKKFGDASCEDPESGEVWQYMGTYEDQHQFRHRNLPTTRQRTYYNVPAQKGDFEEVSHEINI